VRSYSRPEFRRVGRAGYLSSAVIALSAAIAFESRAAEAPGWLSGSVAFELQNDADYRSDDPGNERNNLKIKIEPEITVAPPPIPGLSFRFHGTLDQVADADPGENRYLKDHGLVVEELFAAYRTGRFFFRGGKTNPGFGIAWDRAPGIYGTDMAEDYELAERIVLSGGVSFGGAGWGEHSLSGGAFFLDTSFLQPTVIGKSRGTLARRDGGASNTEDFDSFNLVLEGAKLPVDGLSYHLAYVRQAHGNDGTTDETGVVGALAWGTKLGGDITLAALIELSSFDDFGGIAGADRTYLTTALQLGRGPWTLALARTGREIEAAGAATVDDWQVQVSAGYAFAFGLGVDVGWKRLREADVETDTLGLLLSYRYEF